MAWLAVQLRYTANHAITVYLNKIELVRSSQNALGGRGNKGIAFGCPPTPRT